IAHRASATLRGRRERIHVGRGGRPRRADLRRGIPMTPLRGRGLVVLSTALCCLLILLAPAVRIIQDPAGLWLIIGAPTCVYYGTARRVVSTPDGAALLAFGFTILHDLLVLLGLDLVLPLFGDEHPLQLAPITLAFAAVTILVGALTPEAQPVAREPLWWHRR